MSRRTQPSLPSGGEHVARRSDVLANRSEESHGLPWACYPWGQRLADGTLVVNSPQQVIGHQSQVFCGPVFISGQSPMQVALPAISTSKSIQSRNDTNIEELKTDLKPGEVAIIKPSGSKHPIFIRRKLPKVDFIDVITDYFSQFKAGDPPGSSFTSQCTGYSAKDASSICKKCISHGPASKVTPVYESASDGELSGQISKITPVYQEPVESGSPESASKVTPVYMTSPQINTAERPTLLPFPNLYLVQPLAAPASFERAASLPCSLSYPQSPGMSYYYGPLQQPQPESVTPSRQRYSDEYPKHFCGSCGNARSKSYHKKHPVPPGLVPEPNLCKKCRPRSSEDSTSDNEDSKESAKAKQKVKSHKRSETEKVRVVVLSDTDDDDGDDIGFTGRVRIFRRGRSRTKDSARDGYFTTERIVFRRRSTADDIGEIYQQLPTRSRTSLPRETKPPSDDFYGKEKYTRSAPSTQKYYEPYKPPFRHVPNPNDHHSRGYTCSPVPIERSGKYCASGALQPHPGVRYVSSPHSKPGTHVSERVPSHDSVREPSRAAVVRSQSVSHPPTQAPLSRVAVKTDWEAEEARNRPSDVLRRRESGYRRGRFSELDGPPLREEQLYASSVHRCLERRYFYDKPSASESRSREHQASRASSPGRYRGHRSTSLDKKSPSPLPSSPRRIVYRTSNSQWSPLVRPRSHSVSCFDGGNNSPLAGGAGGTTPKRTSPRPDGNYSTHAGNGRKKKGFPLKNYRYFEPQNKETGEWSERSSEKDFWRKPTQYRDV